LKKILPVPSNEISFKEILKFKKEHRLQLLDFREQIGLIQAELDKCENEKEVKSKLVKLNEKIEADSQKLERSLRTSFISTAWGTLQSFIKPNSPTLVGVAAVIAGSAASLAVIPIAWVAVGTIAAGAIEVGAHLMKKSEERTKTIDSSPFSYIYFANKKLTIK
jgi:hypothetical protein